MTSLVYELPLVNESFTSLVRFAVQENAPDQPTHAYSSILTKVPKCVWSAVGATDAQKSPTQALCGL